MLKPSFIRGLVTITTIATLFSADYRSSARDLQGVVVTGIALDRVASQHPAPAYPQDARSLKIAGEVQLRIQVQNGKILSVAAESGSPMLAAYSSQWVRRHWQFQPSASGVYFLPISYKLSA